MTSLHAGASLCCYVHGSDASLQCFESGILTATWKYVCVIAHLLDVRCHHPVPLTLRIQLSLSPCDPPGIASGNKACLETYAAVCMTADKCFAVKV